MPPPFRAASPHPPLDAFTLHPLRDLPAARCWMLLEARTDPPSTPARVFFVMYFPSAIRNKYLKSSGKSVLDMKLCLQGS